MACYIRNLHHTTFLSFVFPPFVLRRNTGLWERISICLKKPNPIFLPRFLINIGTTCLKKEVNCNLNVFFKITYLGVFCLEFRKMSIDGVKV